MSESLQISKKISRFAVALVMVGAIFPQHASASYVAALSVNGVGITTANVSTTPANLTVPADNSVDAPDAVKVSLTSLAAGSTVSVIANNAFIVGSLSTNLLPVRATSGVASLNINTGTGTTAEFFIYTTSSSLGSFTVSSGGTSNTYYVKGSPGVAYNLEATLPSTGYVSSFGKIALKVTDAFGNAVTGIVPSISAIGLLTTGAAATDVNGASEITVTYPTSPGRAAIQIAINATSVSGLPASKSSVSSFIEIVSLEAQLLIEKAERLKEKQALESQLAAATKATEDAMAAQKAAEALVASLKSTNEANLAKVSELNNSVSKLNQELLALKTTLNQTNSATLALDKKYKALVAKYNKLAKRFKQPTIQG